MKAVVFDMDGVIFDSETLVFRMWKIVAEKYGVADIEETCRACLGINVKKNFLNVMDRSFPMTNTKKKCQIFSTQMQQEGSFRRNRGSRNSWNISAEKI